jgi:AcrR family transcriptional regulator
MSSMSEAPAAGRPAGLRERKKARTRAAIREHALRLFREQGYQATTVEQIAEAAEVSPSTFFRYFPTKEDVVLQDDFDLITVEAFEAQPAGMSVIAAYRAAAAQMYNSLSPEELARFRESVELTLTIPEVRARALDEFAQAIDVTAQAIARRTGRTPDDPAVRNVAGALVGVVMSATMPWSSPSQPAEDMFERIDAGLAHLEAGLPL